MTFSDFLHDTPAAERHRAALAKAGARDRPSAVAEVEQRVAALMQKHDTLDHAAALDRVFRDDPGLYERHRREVTVNKSGARLADGDLMKSACADLEAAIVRRAADAVAKGAARTLGDGIQDVFASSDAALHGAWRRAAYRR